MKDLSEVMFMTRVEDDNSKFHPYNGVVDTHSVQNTQLSRMWGQASENYFASKYYEWADSEDGVAENG